MTTLNQTIAEHKAYQDGKADGVLAERARIVGLFDEYDNQDDSIFIRRFARLAAYERIIEELRK